MNADESIMKTLNGLAGAIADECYEKTEQGRFASPSFIPSAEAFRLIAKRHIALALGPVVRLLREISDAEERCCPTCEGNGRMWADGQAHAVTYDGPTRPCPQCGGSGRLPDLAPDEMQAKAIEALRALSWKEVLTVDELVVELAACHNREWLVGHEGVEPHNAGDKPEECGTCKVLAKAGLPG